MINLRSKDLLVAPLLKFIPRSITANHLSAIRLTLALPIILLLINNFVRLALLTFIVAVLLDFIDGPLARFRKQVTVLGQVLDPLSDKFIFFSTWLLLGPFLLPFFLFTAILMLEIISLMGAFVIPSVTMLIKKKHIVIQTRPIGQIKMALYAVGIILLMLSLNLPSLYIISLLILTIGAMLALVSAIYTLVSI
jgi:phosphatidylglycerophosphate synthase